MSLLVEVLAMLLTVVLAVLLVKVEVLKIMKSLNLDLKEVLKRSC